MSIRVSPFSVRCINCGTVKTLSQSDITSEEDYTEMRSCGIEIQSHMTYKFNCNNPDCNRPISIELDTWEYPAGVINYQDKSIRNAIIVTNPTYTVTSQNDSDITFESFCKICESCGIELKKSKYGVAGIITSSVLRNGTEEICLFKIVPGSGDLIIDKYDTLWLEHDSSTYTINSAQLDDSSAPLHNNAELEKLCKTAVSTLKHLESDKSFRPESIQLV